MVTIEEMKRWKRTLGMTSKEISASSGVPLSTVQKIFSGVTRFPREATLAAILSALYQGRKLSQLDCREFGVEDMRTPVAHLRRRFQGTHRLCSRWIETPVHRSRIKEYWLEEKEVSAE